MKKFIVMLGSEFYGCGLETPVSAVDFSSAIRTVGSSMNYKIDNHEVTQDTLHDIEVKEKGTNEVKYFKVDNFEYIGR